MQRGETIIALDFPNKNSALNFLDLFENQPSKPFVKVGMELFYSEGAEIIREIKRRGHKIFLDLKLHDIPNTVRNTMKVLSALEVEIINLHASGGIKMMEAALEGLTRSDGSRPLLIAVTQLTSTDEETLHNELLIPLTMEETIVKYAQNAKKAGLDGIVCSPWESKKIKERVGESFLTVTPGIRFTKGIQDDQSRIMTPKEARNQGSDYIVVGRPITKAENPVEAYKLIQKEFCDL